MLKDDLPQARARFAKRLKAIRVPRGYRTARSFAEALSIDENRYTRYERGEVEPSLDLILKICSLLNATPNDLLCDYIGSSSEPFQSEPAGFSESDVTANKLPSPDVMTPDRAVRGPQHDATAWLLSAELATLRAHSSGNNVTEPFEMLKNTSEIFANLNTNPFPFLADVMRDISTFNADIDTQQRVEKLIHEFTIALREKTEQQRLTG